MDQRTHKPAAALRPSHPKPTGTLPIRHRRGASPWVGLLLLLSLPMLPALAATAPGAVARNIQFTHVTAQDGLSQQFVHAVVQDRRGYLWFGTQDGLNRYDGHEVVVYEHQEDNPASLSSSFIFSLFVDNAGDLWVGTQSGLNRYDGSTDSFSQPFREGAKQGGNGVPMTGGGDLTSDSGIGNERVRAIAQDPTGVLWVGTLGDGLAGIDLTRGTVQRWSADPDSVHGLPHREIMALLVDRKGQLWIGTNGGGLARFDRVTDTFLTYRNDPQNPSSLSDDHIRSLYEDKTGRLWVGTATGGLNLLNAENGTFKRLQYGADEAHSLSSGQVLSLLEDSDGTLWAGTDTGLSEYRPDLPGFVHYRHDSGDLTSLANDRVNALFQDASGVLWLGTFGGVSRWNHFSETFLYYRETEGFLANPTVTAVDETSDGTLWVGTYTGGLSRINLTNGAATHYRHDDNRPGSLSDDRVMAVHVDANDVVWAGTRSAGLNRFDPLTGNFTRYLHDERNGASLGGNAVTSLATDRDGRLWVGLYNGGLNMLQPNGEFKRFRHIKGDSKSLSSDKVVALFVDRTGVLWVGTEGGGFNRFDSPTGVFSHYHLMDVSPGDGEHEHNRSEDTALDISETRDGAMWIASLGGGLFSWSQTDRAADNWAAARRYNKADGLPSDTVYAVLEGAPGALWLSSGRGLTLFEPTRASVRHFDQRNGLRGNEFQGGKLRSRSGRLYFASSEGLVGFHPGALPYNTVPPAVGLSAFSRDQQLFSTGSGEPVRDVVLGYTDPFVSFEFVALDFVSPDKNQYRYRLEGFDQVWVEAGQHRRATYSNLPAGNYVFRVRAANNDNVWNDDGVAVNVAVQPLPWNSRLAYLVYGFSVLTVLLLIWRSQQRRLQRSAELQHQLEVQVGQRTEELAARNRELEALNEKLAQASVTDSLTGLHNRRYLDQFMTSEGALIERRVKESEQAARGGNGGDSSKLLFFMMIDLDGFKSINDTFGHHAGDRALLLVKDILLECCRQSDSVIRWGGDEFMIVGHASGFYGAKVLAERIREGIASGRYGEPNSDTAGFGRMTASIGLAPFPFVESRAGFCKWQQVAAVADQCAYLAKSNGRNAWVSVCGTELCQVEDLAAMSERLPDLIERRHLLVDGSIPHHVLVAERAAASEAAVAG